MSSLRSVGRSAATRDNVRASLCTFTLADVRRCRTPRSGAHPHLCFYHARKKSNAKLLVSVNSVHSVLKFP